MALTFEIDKEAFEALEETQQGLYSEHGEVFRLDVEGIDPADELKGALQKEREIRKEAERKAKEAQRLIDEQKTKQLEQDEKWKELYEEQKNKNDELKNQNVSIQRDSAIDRIISGLTKDKNKANILKMTLAGNLTVEDGNLKVVNLPGVNNESELVDHIKEQYKFLIDTSQASGGGASGDLGGKPEGLLTKTEVRNLPEHEKRAYFQKFGFSNTKYKEE